MTDYTPSDLREVPTDNKPQTVKDKVLAYMQDGIITTPTLVAEALYLSILSVRPAMTRLYKAGQIVQSKNGYMAKNPTALGRKENWFQIAVPVSASASVPAVTPAAE